MYGNYPARYRRIDRISRRIRHNDGIKDILLKIKDKCKELLAGFMAMPATKKIVYVLGRVLTIAGALFSAKDAITAVREAKELKRHNEVFMSLVKQWYSENYDSVQLSNISETFMRGHAPNDPEFYTRTGGQSFREMTKAKVLMYGAKFIGGLVAAVCGAVASEWAKG